MAIFILRGTEYQTQGSLLTKQELDLSLSLSLFLSLSLSLPFFCVEKGTKLLRLTLSSLCWGGGWSEARPDLYRFQALILMSF